MMLCINPRMKRSAENENDTKAGDASMTILSLQGVGEYDYVPLA